MKISIMQPTYLPWMGYFDLMDQVDVFIFLDTVQFSKQSWQQRNRIKTHKGVQWLTVPVMNKGKSHQKINEVKINESQTWQRKHLASIKQNYQKAPFFEQYFPQFEGLLNEPCENLSVLNMKIIHWIKSLLGITSRTVLASESAASCEEDKVERLVDLCKYYKADEYLSPAGSKEYLEECEASSLFAASGIGLHYHQYEHPTYEQLFDDFVPYMSVLDLLLNKGGESMGIIRSGRLADNRTTPG